MKLTVAIAISITGLLLALLYVPVNPDGSNTLLLFLGRFHPIVLHIPIGALVALFVVEFIQWIRPKYTLGKACEILLWVSMFSAIPAVLAGFLLASSGDYGEELLGKHQWLGWATSVLCTWLLVIRYWAGFNQKVIWLYRPLLFVNVILLCLAGHYGGSLTHGSEYLTKYMPTEMKRILRLQEDPKASTDAANAVALAKASDSFEVVPAAGAPSDEIEDQEFFFASHVQPIMSEYCFGCHGPEKQKGNIRLDELNWDMINGPDAEGWHTALDQINAGEMPPKGKAQPSDDQRRLIVNWITDNLETAAMVKKNAPVNTLRRLTREQYTNTLNDVLHLSDNFGQILPNEAKSKMGFTNDAETLQISPLHIDYYQKIARDALDKAIVTDEKPAVKRYKLVFGDKIGAGKPAGQFRGFQSLAVSPDHFEVHVLNEEGAALTGEKVASIQRNIGVDMRGSAKDRFSVLQAGLNLYSALPHKEKPPRSWQGPSPNLKMLMKDVFPYEVPFVFRVEASRGDVKTVIEPGLISLRDHEPAPIVDGIVVIEAKDHIKDLKGGRITDEGFLIPRETTKAVQANYQVNIPKEGFYQIDFEHPYAAADSMPSFQFQLGKDKLEERLQIDESLEGEALIVRPISLAYLEKKTYNFSIGGRFFVGFRKMAFTPILEGSEKYNDLYQESERNTKKYEKANPVIQPFAGTRTDDGMDYRTFGQPRVVTASNGSTETFEFHGNFANLPVPSPDDLSSGDLSSTMIVGLWNDYLVKDGGETGPPLNIHSIELEAPYYEQWPPKSHTGIFIESPNRQDEVRYTREVLKKFMERAFRRKVSKDELAFYMDFWKESRSEFDSYEESVKEVLVGVLCSPSFLYLVDPHADEGQSETLLASRLSYFLWNAPPDEQLRDLAESGQLSQSLPRELERMVADPRIIEMVRAFAYEWLRIDRFEQMNTNVNRYSDFTRFVKRDMAEETYTFIAQVMRENLSILNLIDSRFTMLNQNLAEFYGIEGVKGSHFQKVSLPADSLRGGLLTQGSILNGHSDGQQSHPIKRAVWLKEKILGEKPPPPPPNVPELDPDTPGFEKLTLKEQLELHRDKASCVDCHMKIDPYGVVFENFDAVGRYTDSVMGKPVDPVSTLPDGTQVNGIEGIRQYIVNKRRDDFTKALVEHLYAYALGRSVTFADEAEINSIVAQVREDDYRFMSVLENIVTSESFMNTSPGRRTKYARK